MKTIYLIATLITLHTALAASPAPTKKQVLAYDYKPLMSEVDGKPMGIFVDFFQTIANATSLDYEIKFLPASRAIYEAHKNDENILLSTRIVIPQDYRKNFIFIKIMEFKATLNGFKSNVSTIRKFEDLKGKTLVYFRGNEFSKAFAEKYGMKTILVNSVDQEIKMVAKKRADYHLCVIENCYTKIKSQKKFKVEDFDFQTFEVVNTYLEIILRKTPRNQLIAESLEKAYRSKDVQDKLDNIFALYKKKYPTGISWKHLLKDKSILEMLTLTNTTQQHF